VARRVSADLERRMARTPGAVVGGVKAAGLPGVDVILPYPPSVNHYWRHVGAKVLVSREGRDYRRAVAVALFGCGAMTGPLAVDVLARPPDRRRRDLDNLCKSLLDAMQHAGAYGDDSQVVDLRLRWREPKRPGGEVWVRVRPADESGA
jgi:crossover junction endodeoxyribonuclease RusA